MPHNFPGREMQSDAVVRKAGGGGTVTEPQVTPARGRAAAHHHLLVVPEAAYLVAACLPVFPFLSVTINQVIEYRSRWAHQVF